MSFNTNKIAIRRATLSDEQAILKYILGDFLENEPTNVALGITVDDMKDFYKDVVQDALQDPVSHIAVDDQGNVIGARLAQIITRPNSNNNEDFVGDKKYPEKVQALLDFLSRMEHEAWNKLPNNVHKLIHGILISVAKKYTRMGIATALAYCSHQDAELNGCQGVLVEATALKSQKMYEKFGYTNLFVLEHSQWSYNGETLRCTDGTNKAISKFYPIY